QTEQAVQADATTSQAAVAANVETAESAPATETAGAPVEQAVADAAAPDQPQATQFLENPAQPAAGEPPKKRGFLSAFFGTRPATAATAQQPIQALISQPAKPQAEPAEPIV